jgi:hypothetical protein
LSVSKPGIASNLIADCILLVYNRPHVKRMIGHPIASTAELAVLFKGLTAPRQQQQLGM